MAQKHRRDEVVYTEVASDGRVWLHNNSANGRFRAIAAWDSVRALDGSVRWVATGFRTTEKRKG